VLQHFADRMAKILAVQCGRHGEETRIQCVARQLMTPTL